MGERMREAGLRGWGEDEGGRIERMRERMREAGLRR
jgi:hypothetical protein